MMFSTLSLALALAIISPQEPQQTVPEGPVVQLDDIEVVRQRLTERVDSFVDQVAAPVENRGPARWYRSVCAGAINFQPAAAQALVDRISEVALSIGLTPGEPGCTPQIKIIATNDGRGTTTDLVHANRRLFVGSGDGMDLGQAALQRFQDNDRPIRWWHVSLPVNADTGMRANRMPGDGGPPAINKFVASRLRSPLRDDMKNVIIIVDTSRLGETSFAQIADYVALVSLAQIDPEGDVRAHDTILNLFSDPSLPGLTEWDLAYLQGLYDAELDTASTTGRIGDVERRMADRERTRQSDAGND